MFEMHVYQYINRYLYDKLKIKDGPKHIKDGFKRVFISKSALQKYIKIRFLISFWEEKQTKNLDLQKLEPFDRYFYNVGILYLK